MLCCCSSQTKKVLVGFSWNLISKLRAFWSGAGQIDFMWPRLALLSPARPASNAQMCWRRAIKKCWKEALKILLKVTSSGFVKFRSLSVRVKRPNALMPWWRAFHLFLLALSSPVNVPKYSELYEKEIEKESAFKGFCQSSSAKATKCFIHNSEHGEWRWSGRSVAKRSPLDLRQTLWLGHHTFLWCSCLWWAGGV